MKTIGIIMAGGKGERLYPLTKERSKPAVPFGGKYRIIDFVLSNFINSGIYSNYVLVQYMSQSLIEYLRSTWNLGGITKEHFITVVPPQMRLGEMWYRGTADAVKQNLNLINDYKPDLVAIFGADHIYRMDIRQMIDFHVASKADVTVSALTVPLKQASRFGTVVVDAKNRISGFEEKPKNPKAMPGNPNAVLASMGNYIFSYDALVKILHEESGETAALDFGKTILPNILKRYRVFAYNFDGQNLPGSKPYEEKNYWRDVGTLEAFWQTNMDLLGAKPKMDLNNKLWPIQDSRHTAAPTKIIESNLQDCMVCDGCVIEQSSLKRCILANDVIVHEKCQLEDCIIMDACEIKAGSRLKKVIMDRHNTIEARTTIGYNPDQDAQHYYIDPDGIVVIPRGISKWQ
ncbi:MAG: glucose-1-phosphate adenylyltransferase [Elusimicrobia bacterium RIFOXYA12_FULL_57_11]|nr:MAG: glucose-1-phosphate adenylyltransferase [Elusimicrobia bacterium RIFOXYA12_FULL_57_11]